LNAKEQTRFLEVVKGLRVGDSIDHVRAILGPADDESPIFTKGWRDQDWGTEMKYVWTKDGLCSNMVCDQYATFIFGTDDRLEYVETEVPGLFFGNNLPCRNRNYGGQYATGRFTMSDVEKSAFRRHFGDLRVGDSFKRVVSLLGSPQERNTLMNKKSPLSIQQETVVYYLAIENVFLPSDEAEFVRLNFREGRVRSYTINVHNLAIPETEMVIPRE